MEKFIITTTPTIEGHPIKEYLGTINVNEVIGTNFFSDFAASFTDVFGGNSGTYQRKMDSMYESAQKRMKTKAKLMGGNAVVGLKTDFDEISGKGKSMFMFSATGTVCKIDNNNELPDNKTKSSYIDSTHLIEELERKKLIVKLQETAPCYLSENEWTYMFDHPTKELVKILMEKYYLDYSGERNKIESLLNLLEYNDASDIVYSIYADMPEDTEFCDNCIKIAKLIKRYSLFNPNATIALMSLSPAKAVDILYSDKPFYSIEDLRVMKALLEMTKDLPDLGQITVGKNGVFSKEKEIYICRNGHKNDKDKEFCVTCGENIKGLTQNHINKIAKFKTKVETLERLLG